MNKAIIMMKTKPTLFLLSLAALAIFAPGCTSPTREVSLATVSFPDVSLPAPINKQQGALNLQVRDTRAEKPKVGKMGGRIGANAIFVISDMEPRLAEILKDALARAGYTVTSSAQPTLETEVTEFRVWANGWTQGAKETFRFRLRDKAGHVLWEKTVTGEDGGMDLVDSFAEKSMNVALTRLLTNAINEFASESFSRNMRAAGEEK